MVDVPAWKLINSVVPHVAHVNIRFNSIIVSVMAMPDLFELILPEISVYSYCLIHCFTFVARLPQIARFSPTPKVVFPW